MKTTGSKVRISTLRGKNSSSHPLNLRTSRKTPAPPFTAFGFCLIGLFTSVVFLQAAEVSWTHVPVSVGDWVTDSNWSPSSQPDGSSVVLINNGGTARLNDGEVGSYDSLRVGTAAGGSGRVEIHSGAMLSGWTASVGDAAGSTGHIMVAGGTWANILDWYQSEAATGELFVGKFGTGNLTLNGGSVSNSNGYIGFAAGSTGSVATTGGSWTNSGLLYVGHEGAGNLLISGGHVSSAAGLIGLGTGTGRVTVSSGTWANAGAVSVGSSGSLLINGGVVSSSVANLGAATGSRGSATVSSGTWVNSDFLYVGNSGTGNLQISGGFVSTHVTFIGHNASGTGSVTVSGGTLSNAHSLTVGNTGAGTLGVSGGRVSTPKIVVGETGTGSLVITGGLVSSLEGSLGNFGGQGAVTVSGGAWENAGDINVGYFGTGSLLVNGGLVSAGGTVRAGYIGNGTIQLQSGTLAAAQVQEGDNGTLTFDGGTLQARANADEFLSGFENGDVTILAGGASIDSNGYSIGISTTLTGSGGLTKQGAGTLVLTGANIYNGETIVRSGTLAVSPGGSITPVFGTSIRIGNSSGDNAALLVDGGSVTNWIGYVGRAPGSTGSVTVTSGTWANFNDIYLGASGMGSLLIEGGLVSVNNIVRTGYFSGTCTIELHSGTLSVQEFQEGGGSTTISLNGGVLQARTDRNDFFSGYEAGDVMIGSGGAFIDTNGCAIGISTVLSGIGRLTKLGSGTLTLSGSSSYGGGTIISLGTLVAGHDHAMGTGAVTVEGGNFHIDENAGVDNDVVLAGGNFSRRVSGNLAGSVDASSDLGGVDTTARILAGATGTTTLVTSFSLGDEEVSSDVYHLEGTGNAAFVLELSFASLESGLVLGWFDGEEWVNSVNGNTGNTAWGAMLGFDGSFTEFQAIYGTNLGSYMGAYGSETAGGTASVWAVLNHNSEFAAIPEPSVLLLLPAGILLCLARRRR